MVVEEFYFKSSSGEKIAAKKWRNEEIKKYRGVVQLVHGMTEHIGEYEEFAKMIADNGYIVVGHDQLGHGKTAKSENELGYFGDKDGWGKLVSDVHILQNMISKEYPKLPYFIFAHSMGSLVVRTYLTKYKDNLAGVILSGTSGQKLRLLLGQILTKIIMMFKGEYYRSELLEYLVTGSFNDKYNPNHIKEECNDPRCGFNFTTNGYLNLLKGTYYLSKQKNINKTIDIPILLISGDKDPVGEMSKGVIRVANMLQKAGLKDVKLRLFKDEGHEVVRGKNKNQAYYVIFNWMNKILEGC